MYRCRLTYDEWKCMISKNRVGKQVNTLAIKGYLGLLTINSVSDKQIWKYNNEDVVVCDNGYHWLTIMPGDEFYCMTVMMDKLQEALKTGEITELQYNRALATSQKLQDGLLSDIRKFQDYVIEKLNILVND